MPKLRLTLAAMLPLMLVTTAERSAAAASATGTLLMVDATDDFLTGKTSGAAPGQRPSIDAQTRPPIALPPIEQALQRIQEGFRTAKTPKEIQSVKHYCRDTIASYSFKDREALMMQGFSLLKQNEITEANKVLAQAAELEKLDANLAALTCKAPGE